MWKRVRAASLLAILLLGAVIAPPGSRTADAYWLQSTDQSTGPYNPSAPHDRGTAPSE